MHNISVAFEDVKEAIVHAQKTHKRAADKHRRSMAYKENDGVLLRFTKVRLYHTTNMNMQEEPTGKPYKSESPKEPIQEEISASKEQEARVLLR